jgi:acetoin utilization deacetylase AcuC-like enzyme
MIKWRSLLRPIDLRRFPFHFVYSDAYWMVDLGRHVFPVKKYRRIYEKLLIQGARKDRFVAPQPASDEDLLLAHTSRYLKKVKSGRLSPAEIQTIEIPVNQDGIDFARLSVGGTIAAADLALREGLCVHLGGGFHHAFADHGEAFCIFNDVAVALEVMRRDGRAAKTMVVDCDVHQGNGTAQILAGKDYAFTFSIHQMDIYPARKPPSSLDVELWSGDGDEAYLRALSEVFPRLFREFSPDLIFYLAGADPFALDQLGGLALTKEGLYTRDRLVLEGARRLGIPVAVVLAGGYASDVADGVAIHFNTVRAARRAQRRAAFLPDKAVSSG